MAMPNAVGRSICILAALARFRSEARSLAESESQASRAVLQHNHNVRGRHVGATTNGVQRPESLRPNTGRAANIRLIRSQDWSKFALQDRRGERPTGKT